MDCAGGAGDTANRSLLPDGSLGGDPGLPITGFDLALLSMRATILTDYQRRTDCNPRANNRLLRGEKGYCGDGVDASNPL